MAPRRSRLLWTAAVTTALLLAWVGRELIIWHPEASRLDAASLADFERELAAMREPLQIPGMSAAIAERGEIIWARGFGLADQERAIPATPNSIYHLVSVTKPYAATVVLQLVDEGKLDLNQPVSDFGIDISAREPVRVRHLLSHTSTETPGTVFRYDGVAFGHLTAIVEDHRPALYSGIDGSHYSAAWPRTDRAESTRRRRRSTRRPRASHLRDVRPRSAAY